MISNRSVLIIAEIGVNHNGSIDQAKQLIDVCANAGVDAVKFQTFKAEQLVTPYAQKADYQLETDGDNTQYSMLKKLELSLESYEILKNYTHQKEILFISSPFDIDSLNFLVNTLQIPILKIASSEMTNAPLLLQAAKSNKKIILSTGMSTLGDIEAALGVLAFGYIDKMGVKPTQKNFKEAYCSREGQRLLRKNVSILHCTSEYPAKYNEINLRAINTLKQCFRLNVGFSDHSQGTALSIAAVALGAKIIEKHVTLDRTLPGPDHKASLEPNELKQLVIGIRQVEKSLGSFLKHPVQSELRNKEITQKSIVAARDIKEGEIFTEKNLTIKRPAGGLSPFQYWELIGTKSPKSYLENELIK